MKRMILGNCILALAIIACNMSGGPAAAPVAPVAPLIPLGPAGEILNTPGEVLQAIELGRRQGTYPVYHGTSLTPFQIAQALEASGYPPEIVNAARGNILSWEVMMQKGICFICFGRHNMASDLVSLRNYRTADGLWVAMENLDGEIPGTGFNTSANYSMSVVNNRVWDPTIAQNKLMAAQARLAQISQAVESGTLSEASVQAERTILSQFIDMESQSLFENSFHT